MSLGNLVSKSLKEFTCCRTILIGGLVSLAAAGMAMAEDAGELTLGYVGSAGPTNVPGNLALEQLEQEGWKSDYIEFDSPDILTQALINGDVDVAIMGPSTVFAAAAAGANLRMISTNNAIDFIVIASSEIESCDELDGQLVAYHSPGATSTFHLFRYMFNNCPDSEPDYIVLAGSANRATALLNGQIKGTIVRLEDWVAITGGEDERARILGVLAKDQGSLLTSAIVVGADQLESRADAIRTFLDALQAQFDSIYADADAYAELALPYLEGGTTESVAVVYRQHAEQELFPRASGITREQVAETMQFYEDADKIEKGRLTPEDVADFSF